MSCQKGNGSRSRGQKYQNSHAFKNSLHDTSHKTKFINNIQVVNVCERCKKIIEWKIKYKKYKPLKAPGKCTKCNEKCIKHAYHIMCGSCASHNNVCPKCGEESEIIKPITHDKSLELDRELRLLLKKLPERKRRTFMRYMKRKAAVKENATKSSENNDNETAPINHDDNDSDSDLDSDNETITSDGGMISRDDLLNKIKSLMITKKRNNDDDNSDDYDSDLNNDDDDDDDESSESDSVDISKKI